MKYVFGSNHLYIGSGIVETLRYLERVYNLDFNKLEEKRLQKRMKVMEKRKKQLIETQKININSGEYVVNVDIPEGTYLFDKDENGQSLLLVNIYNEEGDSVDSVYVHSKEISLNAGDLVRVSYSCTLRIE
jgi:hypothetical protein